MRTSIRTVLITGVTGFIGSHLASELSKRYDVYGLLKFATNRNMQPLQPYLKNVTLLKCDITDLHSIQHVLKAVNPDIVIHLAALSPVRDSFEMPFSYVWTNVHGTLNIAHGMLELPDFRRKKLIYASTAEVYGNQEHQPIKEDAVLNPSSPYANTKSMTDTYLRMMTPVYGLNTTVMRCTNTYGRTIDTSFLIEYLITTMLAGEKIYIGAPDSIRDYMFVSDHVGAYIAALEHAEIKGEAFNATPGGPLTNRDLALRIASMIGFDKKKIIFGKYPLNYPMRPIESDQPFIDLDSTKVKKMLGWKAKVSLEEGLTKSIIHWSKVMKKR